MFFDYELLRRGGKFGTVWLVATRGAKRISNKEIRSVNIVLACNDIISYIMTTSLVPKRRFSLSLSAKLISGVIRINQVHADMLYKDIYDFLFKVNQPLFFETMRTTVHDSDEVFATPQPAPKRKRGKKQRALPPPPEEIPEQARTAVKPTTIPDVPHIRQSEIETDLEGALVLARSNLDNITMIEIPENRELSKKPREEPDFGEGMDSQLMKELLGEWPDVTKETTIRKRKQQRVEDAVITEEPVIQILPEKLVEIPPAQVEQVEKVEEVPKPPLTPRKRKSMLEEEGIRAIPLDQRNQIFIRVIHRKKVFIDSKKHLEYYEVNPDYEMFAKLYDMVIDVRTQREREIVNEAQQQRDKPIDSLASNISQVRKDVSSSKSNIQGLTSLEPIGIEGAAQSTPLPKLTQGSVEPITLGSALQGSGTEVRPVPPPELAAELTPIPTMPEEQIPVVPRSIEEELEELEIERERVRPRRLFREDIQDEDKIKAMLHLIEYRHRSNEVPVTLEDVSDKPLSKKTVAKSFALLLELHKMQYITLVPKEDSIDLSHIDLGAKFQK